MKKILNILTNKVIVIAVVIVIELVVVLYFARELIFTYNFIYSLMMVLSLLLVIWVVNKNDNPSYTVAWAIVILLFPPLGAILYLLFGGRKVPKELRVKISESFEGFELSQDSTVLKELEEFDDAAHKQVKYIYNTSHYPAFKAYRTEYLESGERTLEAMLEEIKKAEKFIFLEYFIIRDGVMFRTLLEALEEKVKEGVDVRLIYDDAGSISFSSLKKTCEEAGIKVVVFNPFKPKLAIVMNNRSHRKACIVDGRVGIVGGVNIADEYINVNHRYNHWKDTSILFEGEAVHSLTLMFLQFYRYYTKTDENPEQFRYQFDPKDEKEGFIQAFSDTPTCDDDVTLDSHLNIITNAKRYVYMQTPYLVIGYEMIKALTMAAASGVDVRIVVPGTSDTMIADQVTKANCHVLARGGVKIYSYTPGFVHSKIMVSDDKICMVGTTNMDFRSYYLHYEANIVVINDTAVEACLKDHLDTFEKSRLVTLEEMEKTPYLLRLFRGVIRIFSGLL